MILMRMRTVKRSLHHLNPKSSQRRKILQVVKISQLKALMAKSASSNEWEQPLFK